MSLNLLPDTTKAQANKAIKSKVAKTAKTQTKLPSSNKLKDKLIEVNVEQSFGLKDCAAAANFPNQLNTSDAISAFAAKAIGWDLSKAKFDKGEFETTKEYDERLNSLALFVGGKESLVFKIPISSEFKNYDADTETMSVSIPIASGTHATIAGSGYSDKALSIDHIEKAGKTVAGQTAMGIKFNYTIYYERSSFVVLDSESIKSFSFASKEAATMPMQNDASVKSISIDEVTSKAAMELTNLKPTSNYHDSETVSLKMPRDKAIKVSNNMYLLLIGSWRKPYYYSEDFEDRASLDNPYYTFSTVESFYIQPRCAYLVNKQNGEILHTFFTKNN